MIDQVHAEHDAPDAGPSRANLRRAHLLESARKLFIDQGFHQTGMAQLAAASGIKVGQIYRDFTSKDDIIAAICDQDVKAWLEEDRLSAAIRKGDVSAIRDWMERFVRNSDAPQQCRFICEIVAEAGRNPRIGELTRGIDHRTRQSLSTALEALTPGNADVAERDALMMLILAVGTGIMTRRALHPEQELDDASDYASRLIDERIAALSRR